MPLTPSPTTESRTLAILLIAASLAMAWVIWPFYGGVFWGGALAILFMPLNRWLLGKLGGRNNLAAMLTLWAILLIVILPLALLLTALVQEGAGLVTRIQSGELSLANSLLLLHEALPDWLAPWLDRLGLGNPRTWANKLMASLSQLSAWLAQQALSWGSDTISFTVSGFIALYLCFFLLRDGEALVAKLARALPLAPHRQQALFRRFTRVIRATVKGDLLVAATQGALGGLAFWVLGVPAALLWGAMMAALSLLPAIGAALVWLPVVLLFWINGEPWKGTGLLLYGLFVIGLVDNFMRPALVGKGAKLPDYVVLISTLGGMALFGLQGFVIGPLIAAMFIAVWDMAVEAPLAEQEPHEAN